jgi:proteasome alpha subunit
VAGIDAEGPKLFETDPTGIYFQFRATVIGEGETEIEEVLGRDFNEKMTIEEGLKLAVDALNKILDKNFNVDRVDAAYITTADKKFVKVKKDKLEKLLREVKKK